MIVQWFGDGEHYAPPVSVLQRPFLGPKKCTSSGQIYAIAAGEKRPPTPVSPPQAGPGIAECRSLIDQDSDEASSVEDVPCRHAHMAWHGEQRSPYEPMTLPCKRIGWVTLCSPSDTRTWCFHGCYTRLIFRVRRQLVDAGGPSYVPSRGHHTVSPPLQASPSGGRGPQTGAYAGPHRAQASALPGAQKNSKARCSHSG